jgi:hypothetical protein
MLREIGARNVELVQDDGSAETAPAASL